MLSENLTDEQYWENYWDNISIKAIDYSNLFSSFDLSAYGSNMSVLEIGGFPGSKPAWLSQKTGIQPSVVDFVIRKKPIYKIEQSYGLEENSLMAYKADLFSFNPAERFDLVMSFGFIEHFEGDKLDSVLDKHLELCKTGGEVFITIPNLNKSFYGLITRCFNKEAFKSHNTEIMSIRFLNSWLEQKGLTDFEVWHSGKPGNYWVPNGTVNSVITRLLDAIKMTIRMLSTNKGNQFVSPEISIKIKKNSTL